jgi:hypothetical protein
MKSTHWKYQRRMLMSEDEEDSITENQIEKKESVTEAFTKLVTELKQFEINNQEDHTNLSKVAKSLLNDLEKLRSTWSNTNE